MSKSRISTNLITSLALLTAIEIVLNRFFSFNVWNLKIGLSFIPVVLAAILFGPLAAGMVSALGDFVGAILFPIGSFFPGFTVVAFVQGILFGLILRKEHSFPRTVLACFSVQTVCTLLLNTWNISFLYGAAYLPLLMTRLVQAGAVFIFELIVIPLLYKLEMLLKRQVTLV